MRPPLTPTPYLAEGDLVDALGDVGLHVHAMLRGQTAQARQQLVTACRQEPDP